MSNSMLIATLVIAIITFFVAFVLTIVIKPLKKGGCLGSILFSLVAVLLFLVAGSLLFNTIAPADGRVVKRSEQVLTSTRGDWSRSLRVTVVYGGDDQAERSAEFLVDGQSYDNLAEGRPVQVRVLALGTSLTFARLVEMNPLSLVKLALADLRLSLPDALAGDRLVSSAVIKEITTVRLDYYTDDDGQEQVRELLQPVDLVVFEFVPEDRSEAVVAVEKVDANSLGTGINGQVQVQYLPENPRAAVLDGASHTYRWKNPLGQVVPVLLIIALITVGVIIWRTYTARFKGESEPDGGPNS